MAKYCTHCGKKIRDQAIFCRYCGKKVGYYEAPENNQPIESETPLFVPSEVPETPPVIIQKVDEYESESIHESAPEIGVDPEILLEPDSNKEGPSVDEPVEEISLPLVESYADKDPLTVMGDSEPLEELTKPLDKDFEGEPIIPLNDESEDSRPPLDNGQEDPSDVLKIEEEPAIDEKIGLQKESDKGDITDFENDKTNNAIVNQGKKQKKGVIIAIVSALILLLMAGLLYINDGRKLSGATLSKESIEMGLNATRTLSVENIDANTKIKWKSSDPSVASVDENGVITTHTYGEAVISASTGLNIHKLECKVYARRAEIKMDEEIYAGNTYTLTLQHTDAQDVEWLSFDNSIAEVTASSKDARKAELTIYRCGPVMIGANVDGDLVTCKPPIKMQEKNVIEIPPDSIIATGDKATFWVAYSFDEDLEFGMLWADYLDDISYSINNLYGDIKEVTVFDVPEGSRTVELFAGTHDGTIVDYVGRRYLTIIR